MLQLYIDMISNRHFRFVWVFLLGVFLLQPADGQRWKLRRYEVGGGLGISQVFGDIGGTISKDNWYGLKDIRIDETSLAFPVYMRYKLDPVYTLKTNMILAFGHGDDADSRNDRGRSYKTMLFEFSMQGEYYFLAEEKRYRSAAMFNRRGMVNNYMSFSAYAFLGIGGTYARANVTFTQDIDPIKDDIKPSTLGVSFPFGLGLKYTIDDRWLVSAELGYRYSLSDYLEGYTQTINSKHNDVYYFLNFCVGYRLETSRRGLPGFLDKEYRKMKTTTNKNQKRPRNVRQALD